MSLYGALYSGVSGLRSQSSAMSAIADNISNVNTIGYKNNQVKFNTLVTKQTSLTTYSSGGVQGKNFSYVDTQGLLQGTSSSTDLAVSGGGFFVVSEAANPTLSDMWGYTRSGSFTKDDTGYLKNTGGFYAQGWSLLPYDGSPNATVVKIDDFYYMKAYKDNLGNITYVNDNVIDRTNLKPINLNEIGGDANPTTQIRFGANLPVSDPIFDAANPEAGGRYNVSTIVYDSLGNSHNVSYQYTKVSNNSWSVSPKIPTGAASTVLYSNREVTEDGEDDVYAAVGQIEFTKLPANHSYVKITDNAAGYNVDPLLNEATTYIYEFSNDGSTSYVPGPNEKVVLVDITTGVVAIEEAVDRLAASIKNTMPGGARFAADSNRIEIVQSTSGKALTVDVSKCLQTKQANANPNLITGIPTGIYDIPEIDWELKNVGRIDLQSEMAADYLGRSVTIGNNVYQFYDSGAGPFAGAPNIGVDIASAIYTSGALTKVERTGVIDALQNSLVLNAQDATRFKSSGTTLEITQSSTGADIMINMGNSDRLTFTTDVVGDYNGQNITIGGVVYSFTNAPVGAANEIDISNITWGNGATTQTDITNAVISAIKDNATANGITASHYQAKGNAIIGNAGSFVAASTWTSAAAGTGLANTVYGGQIKDNGGIAESNIGAGGPQVLTSLWTFNGVAGAEEASLAPAVRFNSDGSPKYFNFNNMSINWSNGAQNMTGGVGEGQKVNVFSGNVNTLDGLTNLSGEYISNYTTQDGARYGSYAGVSIDENGIVRALFDNGSTRPIAVIPLATFVNPNGLESVSGNTWIETGYSGSPTLRSATTGGAGAISASALEGSTVDLAEEFTNMITTQRAYSASAKIITTSDDMLTELMNIKR
ncbi:MAG: Flagellar hook protein FlgE [Alphaproteobacteria bacterium ADurb.Bin438]|nr:MAG: Flagellar hook protein FlgE [Alphaproteobacteria bacterium ADurb.Bin438]